MVVSIDIFNRKSTHAWQILLTNESIKNDEFCVPVVTWSFEFDCMHLLWEEWSRVTKISRLSWLTNSALVYEPKCGGEVGVAGSQQWVLLCKFNPNKLWRSSSIFNLLYGAKLQILSVWTGCKKTAEKVPAQQDGGLQPLIILVQFFDVTSVAFHFSKIQEKCEGNFVFAWSLLAKRGPEV